MNKKEIPTMEMLEQMRNVDVRTVDPATLKDIRDVHIDTSLPAPERMLDFIRQVGNPYCYKDGDRVIKIRFAGKKTMEEALDHYYRTMFG